MGVGSELGPAHVAKPPGAARVILTVGLYLGLNSSLNLLNRYTLGMAGFKFPVSLTCMHLMFQICALAPIVLLHNGRVAAGDHAARALQADAVLVLIGERPGLSSPDSLGAYMTRAPGAGRCPASGRWRMPTIFCPSW